MNISIGVFAYNEEKNIENILNSLLSQKLNLINIEEVFVFSSGSMDNTNSIVKKFEVKTNFLIKLIEEKNRNGKVAAINNFLKIAKNSICIISSADIVYDESLIENLCSPFINDKNLGATSCFVRPLNNEDNLFGFIASVVFSLYNDSILKHPKMGEIVAFRKCFDCLDGDICHDESMVEINVKKNGYYIKNIENAFIYNRGPENIKDFLKQRERIAVGNMLLKEKYNYNFYKKSLSYIFLKFFNLVKGRSFLKYTFWLFVMFVLERYARFSGFIKCKIFHKKYNVWDISESTKKLF